MALPFTKSPRRGFGFCGEKNELVTRKWSDPLDPQTRDSEILYTTAGYQRISVSYDHKYTRLNEISESQTILINLRCHIHVIQIAIPFFTAATPSKLWLLLPSHNCQYSFGLPLLNLIHLLFIAIRV